MKAHNRNRMFRHWTAVACLVGMTTAAVSQQADSNTPRTHQSP